MLFPSKWLGRVRSSSSEDGFTLIELGVVAAIIGILIVLATSAMFSYRRAQTLTGAADGMLSTLRDTQARAQAEVRTYKVVFDTASETYEVCRRNGSGVFESMQKVTLEPGIDLVSNSYGSGAAGACADPPPCPCLFFEPRGVATDGTLTADGAIKLRSTRIDQDRDITITGLTSRVDLR
jgi:prepilin-type N-terminal cleavage/methylation domain-containing protein